MYAKILAAVGAFLIAAAPFAAQAGEVQNRVNHEHARIDQGVRSGQLTGAEYTHLERRDRSIEVQRNRDLRANGGRLTRSEYRQLNARENNVSNSIYFDKHNLARQHGAPKI